LVSPSWFYLSGAGSPGAPRQTPEGHKMVVVVVVVTKKDQFISIYDVMGLLFPL